MNETPWINVEGLRFLNVPSAQVVIDKIFRDDCYRISEIPYGCTVFDVGAFYGEFGIYMAAKKGCKVYAFEPAHDNHEVALWNMMINDSKISRYILTERAVTGHGNVVSVYYRPEHPGGSQVDTGINSAPITKVASIRLSDWVKKQNRPICVKLDCEGSESGIFKDDPEWIDYADIVTMEWHNYDADFYADILSKHGFKTIEFQGKLKLPSGDPGYVGYAGGLLFAKR